MTMTRVVEVVVGGGADTNATVRIRGPEAEVLEAVGNLIVPARTGSASRTLSKLASVGDAGASRTVAHRRLRRPAVQEELTMTRFEVVVELGEGDTEAAVTVRGPEADVLEMVGRITVMLRNERARLVAEHAAGKPEPCRGCGN